MENSVACQQREETKQKLSTTLKFGFVCPCYSIRKHNPEITYSKKIKKLCGMKTKRAFSTTTCFLFSQECIILALSKDSET